ncbi:discoidin domain-containing protein, partial [bacterium]|nr:discoidin domain-containing protein [bacterium]
QTVKINAQIEKLTQEARDTAQTELEALAVWEQSEKTKAKNIKDKKTADLEEEETLLKINLETLKQNKITQINNEYKIKEQKIKDIENLIDQVIQLDSENLTIETNISNKTNQKEELLLQIQTNQTEITNLETQIANKQTNLELQKAEYITHLTNKLTQYKTELVKTKENELTALQNEINVINTELAVIQSDVNAKQTELTAKENEVSALEGSETIAQGQYDNSMVYIKNVLGENFDINGENVEIIYDANGKISEVYFLENGERVLTNVGASLVDLTNFENVITAKDSFLDDELWNKTDDSNVIKKDECFNGTINASEDTWAYYAKGAFTNVESGGWDNAWSYGYSKPMPAWISYEMESAKAITGYRLWTANTAADAMPKNWQFQASNDGLTWTTLDSHSDITNWEANKNKKYKFDNTTEYKYYRLYITAHNGGASTGGGYGLLGEIDMFEEEYEVLMLDAAHGGTAKCEGGGSEGYYPASGAFNDITTSGGWGNMWGIRRYDMKPNTWLEYKMSSPKQIEGYRIWVPRDYIDMMPTSWDFKASNDGVNWVTLDSRSNVTDWKARGYKEFTITNNQSYTYYRLYVNAYPGGGGCDMGGLGELDLLEDVYKQTRQAYKQNFDNYRLPQKDVNGQDIIYNIEAFQASKTGFDDLYNQYTAAITKDLESKKQGATEEEKNIYEREANTLLMLLMLEYKDQLAHLEIIRSNLIPSLKYLKDTKIPEIEQALKQALQNKKVLEGLQSDLVIKRTEKITLESELNTLNTNLTAKQTQKNAKENEITVKNQELTNALAAENIIKTEILSKQETKHQMLNQNITLKQEETELLKQ